jgi:hypothetical protein
VMNGRSEVKGGMGVATTTCAIRIGGPGPALGWGKKCSLLRTLSRVLPQICIKHLTPRAVLQGSSAMMIRCNQTAAVGFAPVFISGNRGEQPGLRFPVRSPSTPYILPAHAGSSSPRSDARGTYPFNCGRHTLFDRANKCEI